MTDHADVVLNDHGAVRRHVEGDLACQSRGLGEQVEVPAGKGHEDRLLHLDHDRLLLSFIVAPGKLDIASSIVAHGRELDTILGAVDHQPIAELREVPDNPLEFTRGHLDHCRIVLFRDPKKPLIKFGQLHLHSLVGALERESDRFSLVNFHGDDVFLSGAEGRGK